jgi:hypothetical protein
MIVEIGDDGVDWRILKSISVVEERVADCLFDDGNETGECIGLVDFLI